MSNLIVVNSTKAFITGPRVDGAEFSFAPGENDCPKSYWDHCASKNKHMQLAMEAGHLTAKDSGGRKARKLADGLDSLQKADALARIARCKGRDGKHVLRDWASKTQDQELVEACRKRLDDLAVSDESDDAS